MGHDSTNFIGRLPRTRNRNLPLHRQVYLRFRDAILAGQLVAGDRLPPSRILAKQSGVSRNTVLLAYEQLLAEGFISGRAGAGTAVSQIFPGAVAEVGAQIPPRKRPETGPANSLAVVKTANLSIESPSIYAPEAGARAFRVGIPALDAFPLDTWTRILSRRARNSGSHFLNYQPPAGDPRFRQVVAGYLGVSRGVRCLPEQVIIVSGAQMGLSLAARVLLNPGDHVWIEDPGYPNAIAAMLSTGARLVPIPVDEDGLVVSSGESLCRNAKMAFVTPSHQFPTGVTMTLERRLALLDWAKREQAWIIEDDYDSEFRYVGRPLAALQGLDEHDRVIYLGTFSKVLFPALRLGYLVVPRGLVETFTKARRVLDGHSSPLMQAVVSEFIEEGHFLRHIRKMRALYTERRTILSEELRKRLGGVIDPISSHGGMHLVANVAAPYNDQALSQQAVSKRLVVPALSSYCMTANRKGLLFGFAAVNQREIRNAIARLAAIVDR
jgi:GntR family transcriptional regulator/MocR family aminotransferase